MANLLQGKVALVTGVSSGIGRTAARIFAREGAKVIVASDKNIKAAKETIALIKAAGGHAFFIKCDVSSTSDVKNVIDICVQTYGRLDYAFNNAGLSTDGECLLEYDFINLTEEDWDRVIVVNLKEAWICLKYEVRQMIKQKYGAIVFVGPRKDGLIDLAKTAAKEFGSYGIRVNVIFPGIIEKTLLKENTTSEKPGLFERSLKTVQLGRFRTLEDIAETAVWLCSDAGSYITGVALPVDDGMVSQQKFQGNSSERLIFSSEEVRDSPVEDSDILEVII
jgi:NAD(P)-dependent dehydrogenase (short-subunit alcohol dehydrogenase family)